MGSSLGLTSPHIIKHLVAVFFKHLPSEKLVEEISKAKGDAKVFIENLINEHYDVLRHVTRVVYYKVLKQRTYDEDSDCTGASISNLKNEDELDDYVNTACLYIFEKLPERLRLDSTPGEIVTCLCLWLAQKVKRDIKNLYRQKPSDMAMGWQMKEIRANEIKAAAAKAKTNIPAQALQSRIHSFSEEDILAMIDRLQNSDQSRRR